MRLVIDIGKRYAEITGSTSDAFAAEINQIISTGDFSELILDLNGTKVISSMAMGTIFHAYQRLKERGKILAVANASEKVTHLLRMVNMSEILLLK